MTLEQLRATEERLREQLGVVRSELAAAVASIEAGHAAERELAERLQKPSEGAYRTSERTAEIHARIAVGEGARGKREQCRREEAKLLVELERTRLGIEARGVRRNVLPVLDDVPSASPCALRWHDMAGEGDARVCAHCKATVLNVAMLEPPQALALIAARAKDHSLFRRSDGTLIAGDCGDAPARHRFARIGATMVGVMLGLAAAVGFVLSHFERPPTAAHSDVVQLPAVPSVEPLAETPSPYAGWKLSLRTSTSSSQYEVTLDHQKRDVLASVQCSRFGAPSATYQQVVDGEAIDDFLRTTFSHTRVGLPAASEQCDGDFTALRADEPGGAHHVLERRTCASRWILDGQVLSDSDRACPFPHCDIVRTLDVLLRNIPTAQCDEELDRRSPRRRVP